jgi:exosome complex component RRP42
MAPAPQNASSTTSLALSPAELAFLHSSLSLTPPVRPDGRTTTQFRPLVAESDVLPLANGSARVCFADGSEAIAGVKAEVEAGHGGWEDGEGVTDADAMDEDDQDGSGSGGKTRGEDAWVEVSIEVPGFRDDDTLPVFLSAMLTEAVLADGKLRDRLCINRRYHWRLYIDVSVPQRAATGPLNSS